MKEIINILHLEDVPTDAELVSREIKKAGINAKILVVPDKTGFIEALKLFSPDIILSDHSLSAFDSHEALRLVKQAGVKVPFILVTATMSDEFAAMVMKEGACDYILKDRLKRLPSAIINSIENQKLQEEQRLTLEKLVFHSENTPLGFIEFDDQMCLKTISNTATTILGWSLKDDRHNELNVYWLVYEEDWEWLNVVLKELAKGRSKRNVVRVRNVTKDLRIIWCEWFISVMINEHGVTYMTLIQDVTENKVIEARLVANDKSLKEAQSIAHIGNWEIDLINKTETWSNEFYNILGVPISTPPSAELFFSFIHPEDLKACSAIFDKVEDNANDFRIVLKNLDEKYVFGKWRFEFNESNHPIRMYGILQNITDRKLAEIERTKLVNDLIVRNAELEQFAYIISHNLRAPVANIIGASCALEFPELTEAEKVILWAGINTSVKKLDGVVTDLNQILQVKGKTDVFKETVHFSDLVNDIKESIINLVLDANFEIKFDFTAIDSYLTLKPYLYSIFYNIISNSIKYRRKNVHCIIEITSCIVNNRIELVFKDNGTGIDLAKNGDRVFGLYKRFHDNIEGKGMGLFMVKTQVEALGGKISVKSEQNKGTEFLIELVR